MVESLQKELEKLPAVVDGVRIDDGNLQLEATSQLRKLISRGRSSPMEEVIQAGVVPRFVEFLMREDFPQLQCEVARVLTSIACETYENTKVVIDHGAVPIFIKLLGSLSDNVREHVKPAVYALAHLVHSNDEEVLTNACQALFHLSQGTKENIEAVIKAGVRRRLVELLQHPSPPVLLAALRAVGNMFSRDDLHTLALPCLSNLLKNNYKKSIKEEACWIISYITKGNHEHIQAVIEADIVAPLVHLLQNAVFDIKKVAAGVIVNAAFRGTDDQIKYENGFVYYLSGIMSQTEIIDKLTHSDMSHVSSSLSGSGAIQRATAVIMDGDESMAEP
ncbi:hypothetical protein V6N13_088077 [Hibiscus sabdariffa]